MKKGERRRNYFTELDLKVNGTAMAVENIPFVCLFMGFEEYGTEQMYNIVDRVLYYPVQDILQLRWWAGNSLRGNLVTSKL